MVVLKDTLIRLESLKTKPITDITNAEENDIKTAEELELLCSAPFHEKKENWYWSVRWYDIIPGYRSTISGVMICAPFFIDPPFQEEERIGQHRDGWNLRQSNNQTPLQYIRLGVGLSANDISFKDMTRCIIPTLGILAKYHPGNRNHVLQRTMLRLEREVQTWNEGNTSNSNTWETSDTLHRRGGMLTHPDIIESLEREKRWLSQAQGTGSWWPEVVVPEGAVDC